MLNKLNRRVLTLQEDTLHGMPLDAPWPALLACEALNSLTVYQLRALRTILMKLKTLTGIGVNVIVEGGGTKLLLPRFSSSVRMQYWQTLLPLFLVEDARVSGMVILSPEKYLLILPGECRQIPAFSLL